MKFCTIVNAGRLANARVLAGSLARHHPEASLTVLCLGRGRPQQKDEPFEVIRPDQLPLDDFDKLLADDRWADLTELLKPRLLAWLLARDRGPIVYLDAAVDLHAPLEPVARLLERHGVVIAPRLLGHLPPDGHRPDAADLRSAGRLGASLVALSGTEGIEPARWWAARTARAAASLPPPSPGQPLHPRRELSRWIDLVPSVFPTAAALSDSASAVSYWNLHERSLSSDGALPLVDGRPLRFLHFEGFDPGRPFLLTAEMDRVRTSENPQLAQLCESYAERLHEAGWRDHRRRADVGLRLPNGMTFDDRLSHLLAEAAAAGETFGDVFTEEGLEDFMRWLDEPAPYGSAAGVNRYLYRIYRERDDLHSAYPDLDGADGEGFAGWVWVFGSVEMGLPDRFLPPGGPGIQHGRSSRTPAPRRSSLPRGDAPQLAMEVTGLLTGTLGLGEAARSYVRALEAAEIPVSTSTVDVRQFVKLREVPHDEYARVEYQDLDGAASSGFRLICLNPDELPRFAESAGEDFFTERPAIGVWAWETDAVPDRWRGAFGLLDEIWVYSSYVAENLASAAPIPVRRVPPSVLPPDPGDVKLDLGIPEGFQFLFMFDFFSTIQRKNPVGLVEAFRLAFEPGEGPQLVVKTINGVHRPEALQEVLWAARGRPDVHVVDRSLSARERDALVRGCDCYVSLHRSEGFGLTLAECMALAKPVVATGYSGPMDFMTDQNSYPVPWERARVGADCEIYPADGTWAHPDTHEAARLMRRVVERPDEARLKAKRARVDIEELYSPEAVGGLIRARLEEIRALWGHRRPPRPSASPRPARPATR